MLELTRGFHIRSADPESFHSKRALEDGDPWTVLGAILVRAQNGDFSELHRVEGLLRRSSEYSFWQAAAELFSATQPWSAYESLALALRDLADDEQTQFFLATLYSNACDLRAVEPLLELHARSTSDDLRYETERSLSHLLEPKNSEVWSGARENEGDMSATEHAASAEEYAAKIRGLRDHLASKLPDTSLFAAQTYSVARVAKHLNERLGDSELQRDRIAHSRMILEASTGIDCSGLFRLDNRETALSFALELSGRDLSHFAVGKRYFFGHAISD